MQVQPYLNFNGRCEEALQFYSNGLGAKEIIVPHAQQAQEDRQVVRKRGGAEMFVHLVEAVQESVEVLRADGEHRR